MFKAIIDWFMVNYEMYLLVGIGFAVLNIYSTLRLAHGLRTIGYSNVTFSLWGVIEPLLTIPFYPVFIIVWLLNKLAQWD